ncbi:MAG TPA: hypothetical protein ENI51_08815 [Candidatus Atribacteria bacterium]|nr:hypothetical protein [Candidatus Atribacteria bacterium]
MLRQKIILSYASKILIQFIQVAASIVVARVAGPTVLGTVAFGLAFVSMFEFLADLGTGSAHIKLISEGQNLGKCISTFSILKGANTCLFFIVVLGIFLIQKYVLNVQFESTAHEYVIMISLITVTINQLLFIPKTTFAGKIEQAKQDIPDFVKTLIYQILRVIIVLLGYKAVALTFGNLISTVLIIPLTLYLFKDYPKDKFDRKLASKYLKISLPILVIGMSTKVINHLDRVALQYFTNSKQVGYYTAGYRIGGFVLMIANSIALLFFPLFSGAAANGDFQYIKNIIEKFERFSLIFIMPPVIFLSLYSDVIVKLLLGSQYLPSISVMAIINLAMFLMVLNMPYANVITGMGFFKSAAILNLFNLFLFISLISIFPNPKIFNLGATGTAITIFLSNLFIGILYRVIAKRICQLLDIKKCVKYIGFGIIIFFGFYFIYNYFNKFCGANFRVIFIFIYFGITYFTLFLLGWINKTDLHNLKELLNMRKMRIYIKGEITGKQNEY